MTEANRTEEEQSIPLANYRRRLYEIGLEIGNVAFHLGNGRDPDDAAEMLEAIVDRLNEESRS
jgi:hypothetical protein